MNVRTHQVTEGFAFWKGAVLLPTVFVAALGGARIAGGHQHTAPWLDEASLDQGLYVELRHPRVIRNPRAFDVGVRVHNLMGVGGVTVREVRYYLPGAFDVVVHSRRDVLASRRNSYQQYKRTQQELHEAGERRDRAEVSRLRQTSQMQLLDISGGGSHDRQRVEASFIPERGSSMNLAVEIDVEEPGKAPRTIRRDVQIPVQVPLPAGDGSWFAGDQHLHTVYSLDAFALDGTTESITDYAAVAQTVGLDWIIITDHTNLNFLFWYQSYLFDFGETMAQTYRNQNDYLVLQGQEMGIGSPGLFGEAAHLLVYPRAEDSTGFLPNPCPSVILGAGNCESEQVILDRVNDNGGIGFIAHPFDSTLLFYAPWDLNSDATGYAGVEVLNSDLGIPQQNDTQAISWWHQLLNDIPAPQGGQLADRPDFPTRFPVGIGNSDAHQPSRIGNMFTYAHLSGVQPGAGMVPRTELMSAFVEGRVVASNGPLVFGEVGGVGTGGVAVLPPGEDDLTVTLQTSPEFGPVSDYVIMALVNGVLRGWAIPQSAGFQESVDIDLSLAPPDKFVTVLAKRFKCDGCSQDELFFAALANPIWLELTPPAAAVPTTEARD